MAVRTLAALLLAGCGFEVGASSAPSDAHDAAVPTDGLPLTCSPGQHACNGRVRETCGANGMWDGAQAESCDYTCAQDVCVQPSNVPIAAVAMCSATAPRLAPAVGTKLVFSGSGGTHIDCSPNCGDPSVTAIQPAGSLSQPGAPNIVWFCLSSISIPGGVSIGVPTTGGPAASLALVSDGDVSIAGSIELDGGDATSATPGGRGAPGGYDGADLSGDTGNGGDGPCGGHGGDHDGPGIGSHWIGGGGGGGGGKTTGGGGGTGQCSNGDHLGGGAQGGGACGGDLLVPLIGGSGGGGGGDGTTGVAQGWAAGGGGGALQIISRTKIAIAGAIRAAGGNGYGQVANDGGGGGGAGGAILLQAPALVLAGALVVDGGDGGSTAAGPGGKGATGVSGPEPGATYATKGQSGSGGGGAGGRIRIEGVAATCPTTASPAASCTSGPLLPQ